MPVRVMAVHRAVLVASERGMDTTSRHGSTFLRAKPARRLSAQDNPAPDARRARGRLRARMFRRPSRRTRQRAASLRGRNDAPSRERCGMPPTSRYGRVAMPLRRIARIHEDFQVGNRSAHDECAPRGGVFRATLRACGSQAHGRSDFGQTMRHGRTSRRGARLTPSRRRARGRTARPMSTASDTAGFPIPRAASASTDA